MKKTLSIVLAAALLLVLAATLFPTTTAFAGEATNYKLVGTQFSFANGLVLIFETNGNVKGANTTVDVNVNGKQVTLDCVVKNEEHLVVCHTTKDLGLDGGEAGTVTAFGQTFSFSAPKALTNPPPGPKQTATCTPEQWEWITVDVVLQSGDAYTWGGYFNVGEWPSWWQLVNDIQNDGGNPIVSYNIQYHGCVDK